MLATALVAGQRFTGELACFQTEDCCDQRVNTTCHVLGYVEVLHVVGFQLPDVAPFYCHDLVSMHRRNLAAPRLFACKWICFVGYG